MKTIKVTNQAEFYALKDGFTEVTEIQIVSGVIKVSSVPKGATVHAYRSATVHADDSATVHAYGSATVRAHDSATVHAYRSATVRAHDSATVHAYGSATVHAYGSATVHAYRSATVHADDSATVHAYGSATVHAYGSATVHAYGSATVHAYGSAIVIRESTTSNIECVQNSQEITRKEKFEIKNESEWLTAHFCQVKNGNAYLFKKVSKDFLTQENTENQTSWKPGATVGLPAEKQDREKECGPGKFHACPMPFFCDEFRNQPGDRYVMVEIPEKELFLYAGTRSYQHKIAFFKGTVVGECDINGKLI